MTTCRSDQNEARQNEKRQKHQHFAPDRRSRVGAARDGSGNRHGRHGQESQAEGKASHSDRLRT